MQTVYIAAMLHFPDGTFREINGHSKNRKKECQFFFLSFLGFPLVMTNDTYPLLNYLDQSIALDGTAKTDKICY